MLRLPTLALICFCSSAIGAKLPPVKDDASSSSPGKKSTLFGADSSICELVAADQAQTLPALPEKFEAIVEWTKRDINRTMTMRQRYDRDGDRGRVSVLIDGKMTEQIYDFKSQEIIEWNDDLCYVYQLESFQKPDMVFFPYYMGDEGQFHIEPPKAVLHFGTQFEKPMGKERVRGIETSRWNSCKYAPEMSETTAVVDWYFSEENQMMPSDEKSGVVPVRAVWNGISKDVFENKTKIDHVFDYIEFLPKDSFEDELFQTPPMTFCEGRKKTKEPPKPAQSFSTKIETVTPKSELDPVNIMQSIELFHDFDLLLSRTDFVPTGISQEAEFGPHPLSVVHDFNTGLAYIQDELQGNCTIRKISANDDDAVVDSSVIKMIDVEEMFAFDRGNWTYTGKRRVRGIMCDIWVAKRTDWPKGGADAGIDYSILEWAFATDDWYEPQEISDSIPISFEVITYFSDNVVEPVKISYHYSGFNEVQLYQTFDIRECAGILNNEEFSIKFKVTDDAWQVIMNYPNFGKMDLYKTLAHHGIISPIRIFDIEFEHLKDKQELEVRFAILGDPTPEDPTWVTTVEEAAGFIRLIVEQGKFMVTFFPTNEDPLEITAIPDSFRSVDEEEIPPTPTVIPWPCIPLPLDASLNTSVPPLPKVFQTRIEFTQGKVDKRTSEIWEYFDGPGNIGSILITDESISNVGWIYNYDTEEIFTIAPEYCLTESLEDAMLQDNVFIGFNKTNGKAHITNANGVFHFGRQFHEIYKGTKMIRGILAHHWQTCVNVPEFFNTTALVDFYFADPFWTMPSSTTYLNKEDKCYKDEDQSDKWPAFAEYGVPLESHWVGVREDPETKAFTDIDLTYSFFSFQDKITDRSVFLTPSMTYCESRKQTKDLPGLPDAFSYKQEMLQYKSKMVPSNVIKQVAAWYDYEKKLVKLEYTQLGAPDEGSDIDESDPIRDVHDFYTGIRYRIDMSTDSCSLYTLPEFGPDVKPDGDDDNEWKFVRMGSAKEFLQLDVNYTYVGQRKIRGADVDVWIAQRDDWPNKAAQFTSTMEWAFLADNWMDKAGETYEYDIPFQLHIKSKSKIDFSPVEFVMNFYDFDSRTPKIMEYDISPCISDLPRKHMRIAFYGDLWSRIQDEGLKETFIEQVWLGLAATGNTTLLRIQEIEIDYDAMTNTIIADFVMLDAPPLEGNIKNAPKQITLKNAMLRIKSAVNLNEFSVTLDQNTATGEKPLEVYAIRYSMIEIFPNPTMSPTPTPSPTHPSGWKPGDWDTSVCTPIPQNESASQIPSLPERFETFIVWTQSHFQRTLSLHEWYDEIGDRGKVEVIDNGTMFDEIYNFPTQELFQVIDDYCIASDVAKSKHLFFGMEMGFDEKFHLASPAGIFHFGGKYKEKYLGTKIVRGIQTNHWQACVFSPEMSDTTAVVDWYFSSSQHTMPIGSETQYYQFPVRATWKGSALDKENNQLYNVEHIFDYVKFIPGLIQDEDDIFETPPMVFCSNRKPTKPTPDPVQTFTTKIEILNVKNLFLSENIMQSFSMYFDSELKLTRLDYRPNGLDVANKYGNNPLSVIHDFSSNLAYVQDKLQGNCTVTKITKTDPDVEPDSPVIKMINIHEMFAFDKGNWTYTGMRKVRGIMCDIWIAKRTDWPRNELSIDYSILEWAFATSDWTTHQEPVPVALEVETFYSPPYQTSVKVSYHFSGFNEEDMFYDTFDIRECAGVMDHQEFSIKFPLTDDEWNSVILNQNTVKYTFYKALSDVVSISPIRFFDIELEHLQKKQVLEVTFSILDDPDPEDPTWKITVEEAAGEIEAEVNSGSFTVTLFPIDKDPVEITAIVGSFTRLDSPVVTPTDIPWPTPHPMKPGEPDFSVCQPLTSNFKRTSGEPPLPKLPKSFQVDIEWNMNPQLRTVQLNEWYDAASNQGKIRTVVNGTEIFFYYDYDSKQIFEIADDFCLTVNPSTASKDTLIFGWENGNGGTIKIAPTSSIFHFGEKYSETYIGTQTVRGIKTNHWQSCIFAPELNDATAIVDWYFTADKWTSAIGPQFPSVPVRAHWRGTALNTDDNLAHGFEYVYEYSNFLPGLEVDKSIFNTPPGVYCKDRKILKKLPSVPKQFTMAVEIIQPQSLPMPINLIHNARFWYNFNLNISRVDYKPISQDLPEISSLHEMREIYDTKNRIIYVQDLIMGNCTILPLKEELDISTIITHSDKAIMRTPIEFFDLAKYNYSYTGQRPVRDGAMADVWIAQRTDWPPDTDGHYNSTFEWSFLTDDWIDSEGETVEMDVPMTLHIRSFLVDNPSVKYEQIHNIYAFDDEEPQFSDFDIRGCMPELETRRFGFKFGKGYWEKVGPYTKRLESAIYATLAENLNLSPLRIVQIDYSRTKKGEIQVYVTLIEKGKPIPLSSKAASTYSEEWLEIIADKLQKLINENAFPIIVALDNEVVVMTALPESFEEVDSVSPGGGGGDGSTSDGGGNGSLSLGALIGIAIVVSLLVAAFLTVLINYIILRRANGGSSPGGGAAGGTTMTSFTNRMFNPNK